LWASDTFVTKLFYYVPYYNRQRWPFRLVFFTSYFLVMAGAFGFEVFYRKIKEASWAGRKIGTSICASVMLLHVGNFLAYYTATPQRTIQQHRQDVPYDEPLTGMLQAGRIITVVQRAPGDERSSLGYINNISLLGFNYATLFGLYHFAGFESLVAEKNSRATMNLNFGADFFVDDGATFAPSATDLEHFRTWGVMWYVVDRRVPLPANGLLKQVYSDGKRVVLHDDEARPFAFWRDSRRGDGADLSFAVNDLTVRTQRDSGGELVVNVLHNPFFSATIDGRTAEIIETPDMQMQVTVPPGTHRVEVSYRDPYFTAGLRIAAGFLVVATAGILAVRRRNRQRLLSRAAVNTANTFIG
jgi:hypothetical protein